MRGYLLQSRIYGTDRPIISYYRNNVWYIHETFPLVHKTVWQIFICSVLFKGHSNLVCTLKEKLVWDTNFIYKVFSTFLGIFSTTTDYNLSPKWWMKKSRIKKDQKNRIFISWEYWEKVLIKNTIASEVKLCWPRSSWRASTQWG